MSLLHTKTVFTTYKNCLDYIQKLSLLHTKNCLYYIQKTVFTTYKNCHYYLQKQSLQHTKTVFTTYTPRQPEAWGFPREQSSCRPPPSRSSPIVFTCRLRRITKTVFTTYKNCLYYINLSCLHADCVELGRACMYVCMYVWMSACVHVCMYVSCFHAGCVGVGRVLIGVWSD